MQVEKLQMLSKHLRQLPDDLWYFGSFVTEVLDCGTVGCAVGHLPDLWSESWSIETTGRLNNRHAIVHKHLNTGDIMDLMFAVGHFFGVPTLTAYNLFVMGYDCPHVQSD